MDAADGKPGDRRATWRGGRPARRPARTGAGGGAGYRYQRRVRPPATDAYRRQQWWLLVQRVGLTAAAVGLVALLVRPFFDLKPAVPLVLAVVPGYDRPLGPLLLVESDRRALEALGTGRAGLGRGTARPIDLSAGLGDVDKDQFRDAVVKQVGQVRGGGPGRGTAIVYVSCVGAVDRDGRACLVPPGVPVGELSDLDQAWLRVTDLLESLASLARRPKRLVVVLDACRSAHGEPFGIIDGGFAAAVDADVRTAKLADIHVVVPAAPGQTSCAAATESASVFTAAFIDGVEGCADVDRDGRVTLGELGDYLGVEVARRALLQHGRNQTPFIVPAAVDSARDVGVSWRVRDDPLAWASPAGSVPVDDWLSERWEQAAALRSEAIATRPEDWAALERLLLRAEQLVGADLRADRVLREDVESIASRLGEPLVNGDSLPGLRLAALAGFEPVDAAPDWRRALESWPNPSGSVAAEPPPAPRDPAEWRTRQALAWKLAVERVAVGTTIDHDAWRRWSDLLGPRPVTAGEGPPWPLEIQAARLLVHWGDQLAWQRDPGPIGRVITLMEDAVFATLPPDARADPMVAATWPRRDAERQRRQAYDLAFVGDEVSVATAARLRDDAATAYGKIATGGKEISAHWQLLDRIRAELPWLAGWWKVQAGVAAERTSSGIAEIDWSGLVASTRDLERDLTAGAAGGGMEAAIGLREAAAKAERPFRALRAAYDAACERLADRSAENPTTLAELRAVLLTPLVVGSQRLRLLEREHELATATAQRKDGSVGGGRNAGDGPAVALPVTTGWVRWPGGFIDPFVAAVALDPPGVPQPETTAAVTRAYAAWGQLLRQAAAEARMPSDAGLATAAATSRRLAILRGSDVGDDSPATEHVRTRWCERLVTAAEAAVDEFLARDDRDEPEWFLAAAEASLAEALRLANGERIDQRAEGVGARLEALAKAGDRWATLVNNPDRIGGGDERGSAPVTSRLEIAAAVPPGEAAVWLSPGSREEALWLRLSPERGPALDPARGVPLPVARPDVTGQPQTARWRVDAQSVGRLRTEGRGTLDVTAWFRGHRIEAPLRLVTDGGGVPVVWRRRDLDPPRITVAGQDKQTGYVTFIFDCSNSMRPEKAPERMAKAKEAFQAILESLAQTRAWEASVWFYGHRAKWKSADVADETVLLSPLGMGAGNVNPDLDVEQIQPMNPVGRVQESLKPVLRKLEGWGQTPLYLAVCDALETDVQKVPPDAVWRIIVLTDGVNYAGSPNDKTQASVLRSLASVNEKRAAKPVAIDVIALDLTPRPDERAEYEKLRGLVRDAKGQWRDASDLAKLTQAFRDFLQLQRWEVTDSAGKTRGKAELRDSVSVTPGRHAVRLEDRPATETTIELTGGEIIELFAAGPDRPLEHRRYDGGTEQGIRDSQAGLDDPGAPNRRWFVAAHLPRREGTRVWFPVSLQSDDERLFSPRPVELWAEVRPRGVADARPFVFVDPDLEPGRPVPVIDLDVSAWPEAAEEAEILVWFSPRRIDPAAEIRLDALGFGEKRPFQFPDKLPGVTLAATLERIDEARGRLTIVEKHEGARDLPRVRLRVEPTCERAEHLLDEAAGTVTHVFDIALEKGKVPDNTLVSLVDRDALKEHCVKPAEEGGRREPLNVRVPRPE